MPPPVNLRVDPFEQLMDAPYYPLYVGEKLLPAGYLLQQHAATFRDFPPRQAPADFNPQAMLKSVLHAAAGLGNKKPPHEPPLKSSTVPVRRTSPARARDDLGPCLRVYGAVESP
jgi:hypothetical protein